MKRLVIDTNVVISASLKRNGTSRKAFIKAVDQCLPLLALETIIELEEVLSRPKFERFIAREDKLAILELLAQRGELIETVSDLKACRDASDNKFLNLAIDGKADLILTGDPDLLILHPFEGIPILTPDQFIDML